MEVFDIVAQEYDRYRPSYPKQLIDFLKIKCRLNYETHSLDVGCGTGLFTLQIAPFVGETHGIDPSPRMLAIAKQSASSQGLTVKWHKGVAESLSFPSDYFDFVSVVCALHLMKEEKVLSEFSRVTKKGGHLAVIWTNPLENSAPWVYVRKIIGHYRPSRKIAHRTHLNIKTLMSRAGFRRLSEHSFRFEKSYTVENYASLVGTSSLVAKIGRHKEFLLSDLRQALGKRYPKGVIKVRYVTDLYLGTKESSHKFARKMLNSS